VKNNSRQVVRQNDLTVRIPRDYPWKVLTTLVKDLGYCLSDQEKHQVDAIIRSRSFDEYLSLGQAWGPQSNYPNGLPTLATMRAKYQISALLKKFRFPSDASARKASALKKFYDAEEVCRTYNRSGYVSIVSPENEEMLRVFTYARQFLLRLLGNILPESSELRHWSRHGPGANLDTTGGRVSLYDKYSNWPYSCTSDAFWHARSAIQSDERWIGALEDSYREAYCIPKYAILNQEVFWNTVIRNVDTNRIAFVPKNAHTDRSIAIEPAMNLYLQLGVDGFIRRRLKRWGVDLDDQTKNQRLAGQGSKEWMGSDPFCTLDLAAASDTVSISLCRTLLPPQWFNYLMDLRSPRGVVEGVEIEYEKISSMGNGFTFALESAIFAALAFAAVKETQGQATKHDFAIFGDDIVVRSSVVPLLVKALNQSGFSINEEKSFVSGPFRESCGADWFCGQPVRPVFLTESPETVCGVWCDLNRLRRTLSLWTHEWESETCDLIQKWIPVSLRDIVGPPSDESFDSYMHVPRPVGRYRNSVWKFHSLSVSLRVRSGCSQFLFRKLMATLRQHDSSANLSPLFSKKWGGAKLSAGGNAFAVTGNRDSVDVRVVPTQVSVWPGEYTPVGY